MRRGESRITTPRLQETACGRDKIGTYGKQLEHGTIDASVLAVSGGMHREWVGKRVPRRRVGDFLRQRRRRVALIEREPGQAKAKMAFRPVGRA